MKRSIVNLVIDAFMMLLMSAIIGIGLMMKYVLLPGQERLIKYGRNVELYFWGFDRHEWGDIHLYLAYVLIALLVLHIILHWGMVVAIYRNMLKSRVLRRVIAVLFSLLCLSVIAFFVFVNPVVEENGGHGEHGSHNEQQLIDEREPHGGHDGDKIDGGREGGMHDGSGPHGGRGGRGGHNNNIIEEK